MTHQFGNWVGLTLICMFHAPILSSYSALSDKLSSAQAESGKQWNRQNQSQPNPVTDLMSHPVSLSYNITRADTLGHILVVVQLILRQTRTEISWKTTKICPKASALNMTDLLSTGSALLELSTVLPAVTLMTGLSLMGSSPVTMLLTALVVWLMMMTRDSLQNRGREYFSLKWKQNFDSSFNHWNLYSGFHPLVHKV